MCIQQRKTIKDEKRLQHRNEAYYIKTPAEMNAYFKHIPEALENTARIAERADVELELGKTYLPKYKVPEGYDPDTYVPEVARDGLKTRFEEAHRRGAKFDADPTPRAWSCELDVISKMGFPATSSSSGTSSTTPRSRASPSGRAAARAPARWSRTACASPTSIRSRTTCCSSAS